MVKQIVLLCLVLNFCLADAQENHNLSTVEFIEIIDDNEEEAMYYYQENWKVLRDLAKDKGYIESYKLMRIPNDEGNLFDIVLITTYNNSSDYEKREKNFAELIKINGPLKLLNDKKPDSFRKTKFAKANVFTIN